MTDNRREKQAARALAAEADITYTAALRLLRKQKAADAERLHRFYAEVTLQAEGTLDSIQGMDLAFAGDLEALNTLGIVDPSVQSLILDPTTLEYVYTGTYEGGTKTIEVTASAELVWEGVLAKALAYPSVEAGQAEFIDADLTAHDSLVQVTCEEPVTVTLLGVVAPDNESVESLEYGGALVGRF